MNVVQLGTLKVNQTSLNLFATDIVVDSTIRGKNLGKWLITTLVEKVDKEIFINRASLWVLTKLYWTATKKMSLFMVRN